MSDIKKYGTGEGVGFYWTREAQQFGAPGLVLIAVDDLGTVTRTQARRDQDEAALTDGEAVLEHLGDAIKQADGHLERRRRKLAENPPEAKPEPMSPATRAFFEDADW